ncbi:hypothetical protein GCM10019017_25260 [Streptomyces showdoensis]
MSGGAGNLLACTTWRLALAVLVSPVLMTLLLTVGSGERRLLERYMDHRPGHAAYAARTSGFFPLPPRKTPRRAPEKTT